MPYQTEKKNPARGERTILTIENVKHSTVNPVQRGLWSAISLQHAKLDILKAEISGKMRKFTEADFQKRKIVPRRAATTRQVAKRKKPEIPQEKEKPGKVYGSSLPGVEVAGLSRFACPQPIWSRLHTVELASYRLRKDSMKFPPLAVIESFPHGLSKSTDSNPHHSG